jgi:hypothetical protein
LNTRDSTGPVTRKSRIVAWSTSISSGGMPALICMSAAPARIAPKRRPEKMMPYGLERASRATAIASKPTVVPKLLVIVCVTPRTTIAPASPASRPHSDIVRTISVRGFIPA